MKPNLGYQGDYFLNITYAWFSAANWLYIRLYSYLQGNQLSHEKSRMLCFSHHRTQVWLTPYQHLKLICWLLVLGPGEWRGTSPRRPNHSNPIMKASRLSSRWTMTSSKMSCWRRAALFSSVIACVWPHFGKGKISWNIKYWSFSSSILHHQAKQKGNIH